MGLLHMAGDILRQVSLQLLSFLAIADVRSTVPKKSEPRRYRFIDQAGSRATPVSVIAAFERHRQALSEFAVRDHAVEKESRVAEGLLMRYVQRSYQSPAGIPRHTAHTKE